MSIDSLSLILELLEVHVEELEKEAEKVSSDINADKLTVARVYEALNRAHTALQEFNGKWHK